MTGTFIPGVEKTDRAMISEMIQRNCHILRLFNHNPNCGKEKIRIITFGLIR
jgi:hypothetical protein